MKWLYVLPLTIMTNACNADSTKKDIRGVEIGMSMQEAASAFGGKCIQNYNSAVGLHCADPNDLQTEMNIFGSSSPITNVSLSFCSKESFDEIKSRVEKTYAVSLVGSGSAADERYSQSISNGQELTLKPEGKCMDSRNGAFLAIMIAPKQQHPDDKPRL